MNCGHFLGTVNGYCITCDDYVPILPIKNKNGYLSPETELERIMEETT